MANAILAYAAKVLKELHESQVVAGKGAGTNDCLDSSER